MVISLIFTSVIIVICKLCVHKADQVMTREISNHPFDEFEVAGINFGPILDSAIQYGKSVALTYDDASYKSYTTNDKISNLIGWMCARNGASGAGVSLTTQLGSIFTAGLASPLLISGQMSVSMLSSLYLQIALASGIAYLHGLDVNEGYVQTLMLAMVLGDIGTEFVKSTMSTAAASGAKLAVKSVTGEFIKSLNSKLLPLLGQKFLTKRGTTGLINLGSWVPFVGPLVSLFVDTSACIAAAYTLDFTVFKIARYFTGFSKNGLMEALKKKQIDEVIYDALDSHKWDAEKLCQSGPMEYQTLKLNDNDNFLLFQFASDFCKKFML